MTLDQFKSKHLGKQVEYHSYDPAAKFQCVDLVNQYISEVLKLTPVIGTHAKDFPTKIDTKQFEVIKNTADFKPLKGDIAIWNGKAGGGYGHIAIVIDDNATLYKFSSLDQNYSEALFVTLESHSYTNVSHFLRAKLSVTPSPMPDNADLTTLLNHYKVKTVDEFIVSNDKELQFLADERIKTNGLENTIRELNTKHSDFVQKIISLINAFGNPLGLTDEELAIKGVAELVKSTSDLQRALSDQEKAAIKQQQILEGEKLELQKQLDKLQTQFDTMQAKHADDLEKMQERIDKVKEGVDANTEKQDAFETIKKLLNPLVDIVKGWYGKTK